ncbi:hypothetical protein [Pseudophaeobacter profundi]|uniref:hypothetical protein n=1 Tax=Pseudophaeobacter profundi TaxID=3034152 RepID=UPI00242C1266|nr:hypothetical protein [Pseudophaeobacter profundi]
MRRFEIDQDSLPDLAGMMLATVEALRKLGGSATIQELDEEAISLEGVTEAEQSYMMANNNMPLKTVLKVGNGPFKTGSCLSRNLEYLNRIFQGISCCRIYDFELFPSFRRQQKPSVRYL